MFRKYIVRFLARRSEGTISVMNFNHWTGGWDPAPNPVKSIMISYDLPTRRGSIIVYQTCQQPMIHCKEVTDPEDVVHQQLHVDGICLNLGGKHNEHSNVFVLEGGLSVNDDGIKLEPLHLVEYCQRTDVLQSLCPRPYAFP